MGAKLHTSTLCFVVQPLGANVLHPSLHHNCTFTAPTLHPKFLCHVLNFVQICTISSMHVPYMQLIGCNYLFAPQLHPRSTLIEL